MNHYVYLSILGSMSISMIMVLSNLQLLRQKPFANAYDLSFHIAPMQGYTNAQTRKMFHLLSPSSIKWTEMEKLDDIFPKNKAESYLSKQLEQRLGPPTQRRDKTSDDNNLILQLGTNDPVRLKACVTHTMKYYNPKEINLNCGCPAIESGGASTYGASLMKDAELTGKLVKAAREGLLEQYQDSEHSSVGISVKCRIGVFENETDMRPMNQDSDYEYLKNYISTIHENGGNHVILHARPAILSGLSPVKNRIVPTLDYDFVERIASDFEGNVDITLNGGITTLSQLNSFRKKYPASRISGHMAGRWCLRRPLDLICIEDLLQKGEEESKSSSLPRIQNAIERYIDDSIFSSSLRKNQKPTIADLCLPLFLITEQLKDDYDDDDDDDEEHKILSYDDIRALNDILVDGISKIEESFNKKSKKKKGGGTMNLKRLSSSFKSLVGTKVVNKWKRNRAEL